MAEKKKAATRKAPARRAGGQGKGIAKTGAGGRAPTPLEEMHNLMDRMDRLFDDFMPGRWRGRFMSPFEEMERFFEEGAPGRWLRPLRREWPGWGRLAPFEGRMPKVDVLDRDDAIVIHAEVPGVTKDDLDVSLSEDSVTIKGSTGREEEKEEGEYHRREMTRGEFSRTIPLPTAVDGAKAKATFKDGVMELALPKVEKSKRRTIKVE